ncbi:MAG: enoyl-CoA hydratase [Pseudomonadota bacterium]
MSTAAATTLPETPIPATDKILTEREGVVARIIFNQPEKRNAVNLEMWEAVEGLLDAYADDPSVRVLIVSGAGGKAFVSGADISKFESERSTKDGIAHYNAAVRRVYDKVSAFPKPVIAQIDGFCVGGGMALAICCDIRICGDNSQFAVPAAKLGLGYGYGGIRRLVEVVGPAFAKEIFFTARRFDAEEARIMGLVNRVVPAEDVAATAAALAETIAANAPLTVNSCKYVINEAVKDRAEADLDGCARRVEECFDSQDYIEGRRAFMEKRKPNFIGA